MDDDTTIWPPPPQVKPPEAQPVTRTPGWVRRGAWGGLTGFVFATLCWMFWGMITPGRSIAHSHAWRGISLLMSALAGSAFGCHQRTNLWRVCIALLALAALAFWLCVPQAWWTEPPPAP